MPFPIDIDQNEFLREIYQKGEAKGEAKGELKGRAEGALEATRSVLVELIEARFGAVPAALREQIENASREQLRAAIRRCQAAPSPDQLFSGSLG